MPIRHCGLNANELAIHQNEEKHKMKLTKLSVKCFCISMLLFISGATALAVEPTSANTIEPVTSGDILRNSALAQKNTLQTFVHIGDHMQAELIDVAEPCTFVAAVVTLADSWPQAMFEVPEDANLSASEVAELQQTIADSQALLDQAYAIEATSFCLKPNGLCCDNSDPVTDACVTSANRRHNCNLAPPSLVCSAASNKC